MGFFSQSASITRYRLPGPLPGRFWDTALEAIRGHAFVEAGHSEKEIAVGWVPAADPFRTDITLNDICFGGFLLVAMRVDERKVPPQALKRFTLQEEARVKEEKGLKKLGRRARSEIRDRVRQALLSKVLPVPRIYDCCMEVSSGSVLFMGCQSKARGLFEGLFYNTFSIRLDPVVPFTLAEELMDRSSLLRHLDSLRPFTWR